MSANGCQSAHGTIPISPKGAATPSRRTKNRMRNEVVRLQERTRIAQELHDTLLQDFLGALMQLGMVVDCLPMDSPVKARLNRILQLMQQGIEDGRDTLTGLRLSGPHAWDLVTALSGIREELEVHSDMDFRVVVAGRQQPLQQSVAHEIYRIVREALVNALRHSGAKCVELRLEYSVSEFRAWIRDAGCGIHPDVLHAGREGHWGLVGMRERTARVGGLLKISSSAKDGTEIQLSVPSTIAFQPSPSDHGL